MIATSRRRGSSRFPAGALAAGLMAWSALAGATQEPVSAPKDVPTANAHPMPGEFRDLVAVSAPKDVPTANAAAMETPGNVPPVLVTEPWFIGPLLTPSATVLEAREISLEPFLSVSSARADFGPHGRTQSQSDSTSLSLDLSVSIGLTDQVTFSTSPQMNVNFTQDAANSAGFADLPLDFQVQLWGERTDWPVHAVSLHVGEIFPTGAYENLNSGGDAMGGGSFVTQLGATGGRLWHLRDEFWLHTLVDITGFLGTDVEVRGLNSYGGGLKTRGRVDPGDWIQLQLGTELSLSQQWAVALDLQMVWAGASTFRPDPLNRPPGLFVEPAATGAPSSNYLSFAPALEYSVNASIGIIGGIWFSPVGRNTQKFMTGLISTVWSF